MGSCLPRFPKLTLTGLESLIVRALAAPLPGVPAQGFMAPRPPIVRGEAAGAGARAAAGLLLLFPGSEGPSLALTSRASHLPHHAGQVSLPGGRVEPGETFGETALREAAEEIGVDPSSVRILGTLTPLHIPVSGFLLHAVLGVSPARPDFRPAPGEVARILEVPVHQLADPGLLRVREQTLAGRPGVRVPFFDLHGEQVWGATAMILSEFLSLVGAPVDPWVD